VAPDSSHNPARIAFIRRFGWDTVTTFSQNEEIHSLAVNDLVTELESANISCAATITFAETDFKDQLRMLRVGNHFIILFFSISFFFFLSDITMNFKWEIF
jgi:gamma-aminobutyric acid type B receptor